MGTLLCMSPRPNPETVKRMRALVDELQESGLSVAAFARMKGEPSWRLYDWRRRLTRTAPSASSVKPAFVPVRVVEGPTPPSAPLEIHLDGQRKIVVHPGFDDAALRRLVKVLEAC